MESSDLLNVVAVGTITTIFLSASFVIVRVYLYLRKEERETKQWLKDMDEQHQRPTDEVIDGTADPDDYADIDSEADTVEFTPLPPDAAPPKPRKEKT